MNLLEDIQNKYIKSLPFYIISEAEYLKAKVELTDDQFKQMYFIRNHEYCLQPLPGSDELTVIILDKIHSKVTLFWVLTIISLTLSGLGLLIALFTGAI